MIVEFKFDAGQYVKISLFGLNYHGRVLECGWSGRNRYRVQYTDDKGDLKDDIFLEDELCVEDRK